MNLQVSSSPHIRDNATTASLMRDVIIALLPSILASGILFGIRAVTVILVSVLSCVLFEYISRRIMKRNQTISDLTAVITGILLAFNLPPTIPYYMVVIGAFFSIVVAKQMFGGLGNNFVNPALAGRIILAIAFPADMTAWATRTGSFSFVSSLAGTDLVSSATPMAMAKSGSSVPAYLDLFLGNKAGCIGEICILALLIGAVYLVIRKVITLWIPLTCLGTVTILLAIAGKDPLFHLLSGGLILGAFFMATDYVTSPVTRRGRFLFGLGCGLITVLIRLFGNTTEGVSFAILLLNILTPHIDRFTEPKRFGHVREVKHEKG
jgi:electron transport complex protein RnfD